MIKGAGYANLPARRSTLSHRKSDGADTVPESRAIRK